MMDSQETALQQSVVVTEGAAQPARVVYTDKKDVLARIQEIAQGSEEPQKDETDYLKTAFYKLHIAEREAALKAYLDNGGKAEEYVMQADPVEDAFKAEMAIIKERRAKILWEQEAEKEANLKKKLDIIEKIKALASSPEEANKTYQEFKALQAEWKEIGNIPAPSVADTWRNYQLCTEQFYDLLKLNAEAREYDFRKNMEIKTRICDAAEKLADEEDVISAFHQLQALHQEFRETGPVAKDEREAIWKRFKDASTIINKRHQQHFEDIRAQEEENLTKKTALCEQAEALSEETAANASEWEKLTEKFIALQTEWKTIGFAPQKMNVKIFERFRAACDKFFNAKGEYFKALKEAYTENVAKKQALVERAQALKDSTEWKKTADELIQLQKEWKSIGMVPKKIGDQLWSDFLSACNTFFEARKAQGAGQRNEEHENLTKKQAVVEEIKALAESAEENLREKVQQLSEAYNAIGHVPYKEKDKVYEAYRSALDSVYKKINSGRAARRLQSFKEGLKKAENNIGNERQRLQRQFDNLKQEVQTYENNLGFLSISSKKGNSLVDDIQRKIETLKEEMKLVKEKIKTIDEER